MLTIKAFSRITAIPETTLRYYDEQGVLSPRARGENGYRLYEADQILPAKFLYSLRLASVPMAEVRSYHQSPPDGRQEALARWHGELGERIAWLSLARKYIEGLMQGRSEEIHLQVTEPMRLAWFIHEGPVGQFDEHYMRRGRELAAAQIATGDEYFQWVCDLEPGRVRGRVGFHLTGKAGAGPVPANAGGSLPLPEGAELEEIPSALMLSLEHREPMAQIPETHGRLLAFMKEHGWEAVGKPLERYPAGTPEWYVEILIPILYMER